MLPHSTACCLGGPLRRTTPHSEPRMEWRLSGRRVYAVAVGAGQQSRTFALNPLNIANWQQRSTTGAVILPSSSATRDDRLTGRPHDASIDVIYVGLMSPPDPYIIYDRIEVNCTIQWPPRR